MEHSRLLKFLVPARRDSIEMAETPSFKVQYEYQNPNNVESEVPGSQNIREVTEQSHVENADGDEEIRNGGYMITQSSYTEHNETVEGTKITRTIVTHSTSSASEELVREEKTEVVSEKTQLENGKPKTKIPRLKFRQAAERVRRERRLTRGLTEHETHIPVPTTSAKLSRHSKIPSPTSKPIVLKRDNVNVEVTRPDEEFDKIYEEIVENTQTEIEVKHPEIIESKFEEIIHDYDENNVQPINVEKIRQSRIPSLRRRVSEHIETKTVEISDRPKSRSLPRLKEISMRVKADNEDIGQVKYSRSVSTEKTNGGGQKRIIETKTIKKPEQETKISKVVTTETITSGNELNKNIEGNSKSVTVQRTLSVKSQGEAFTDINKNVDQSNTFHTENIMKGSIKIGYPQFEAKVTENTEGINTKTTEILENINNERKNISSEVNKTVVEHTKCNVSKTTSTIESNTATKLSITKLTSNYEVLTGANEIISSNIFSGDEEKSVEITEQSPTIERTMTITRLISASNDSGQIKRIESPKSPTAENNSLSIATEGKAIEIRSNIPTIEHNSTITRVVSTSNDVSVKAIKDFETSTTENWSTIKTITTNKKPIDDNNSQAITNNENHVVQEIEDARIPPKEDKAVKKVTMVRKIVDVQNKSPTIERSVIATRIMESNDLKTKEEIEENKSPKDGKDNRIKKSVTKIITAINKQMGDTTKNVGETTGSNMDASTEYYEIKKETNAEELTAVTGTVGKLIHRIDSNEVTTETVTKQDQTDELPKKKSILSKIAMFERCDVEDKMPRKKPENLSKLVIKTSPQKVAHLHTPTIVEEVLKSHENSPLTATSNKDYSGFKAESVTTSDYKLNTEIKQFGEYKQDVNLINSQKDHSFVKSESITEFDYKVNADEYKQIVEMSKVHSNPITKDYKDNILKSDYKLHEVKRVANEFEQKVEIRKEMSKLNTNSHYDVSSIRPELVSTVEHKFDADIKDGNIQYEQGIEINDNSFIIAINKKDDNAMTPDPPRTLEYQFKGVNKLTSEYERKAEISKNTTLITKDTKIDYSFKSEPVRTMEYNIDNDMDKATYEIDKNDEISKHITEITDRTNDNISLKYEPVTTFDYNFKVDNRKQSTEYNQIADETGKKFTEQNKEENPVTSEAPTIEYTFKDVRKLATEYEQKVEYTKNSDALSRMETLSPSLLNYDSKYISKSSESLGKVMTDAPVILIRPKFDFQANTSTNKRDFNEEISTIQVKQFAPHQAADTREMQLPKQIGIEDIQTKNDDNILATSSSNPKDFERSTSLKSTETSYFNNSKTINQSKSMFTQSSTNVSTVNWVPKGTIVDNKLTSEIQTSKVLETAKGDYIEVKTVKPKGYVIKQEGDLAYARIQEEAEYGDEIRTFSQVSKLPRTPVKETTSTVTRRFQSVEEKKKYYADVDINTVIKGKVSRMISRMTSMEIQEADKKIIDIKEMPRKMSVLEKIAMFESKASASKTEYSYIGRTRIEKAKPQIHNMTREDFEERVAELKGARLLYGRIENMPNILLRNGVEMPVLALGTATLDTRLIPYIIGAAIDLGYRAIDTAYIYGNEKEIGDAIRAKIEDGTVRRDELFIISKLWSTYHRTDLVEKACRSSLEAMGLEYFDLYLIHNPMSFKEGGDAIPKIATVIQYSQFDYLDAWYGMEQLMSKGLVRSIGVSNFNSVQIQRILDKGKIKPTVNQVECHPYLSQQKLDSFCEERDIKLSCYGVLGSKGTPAEFKNSLPPVIDDPLVQVMASGLNVSPAQLLIRYQLDSGRTVVVKSSSGKHLWDNLQALTFELTQGHVEALLALNRNKRNFIFKGMGDTHRNYPFKAPF